MKNLFGYYLNSCRREKGLSLRECAALCNISHTHIDSLEKGKDFRTGKKVSPTPETIEKIATGLMLREQMLFNLSLEKVNSKFNCFLYYTEGETLKSNAREILSNNDLRSLRTLDELLELQENIFLSLFSRSVEAANFHIDHADFPTYISMLLQQKQFESSIEPAIYKKLVEKYGTSSGIPEGSTYYIINSHVDTMTDSLTSNLKNFAQILSVADMEEKGLRPSEMNEFPIIDFTLYREVQDLTDEEKQDVLDYIQYKKSKKERLPSDAYIAAHGGAVHAPEEEKTPEAAREIFRQVRNEETDK